MYAHLGGVAVNTSSRQQKERKNAMALFGLFKSTEEKLLDAVFAQSLKFLQEVGAQTKFLDEKFHDRLTVIGNVFDMALISFAVAIIDQETEGKYLFGLYRLLPKRLEEMWPLYRACADEICRRKIPFGDRRSFFDRSRDICVDWTKETIELNGLDETTAARVMAVFAPRITAMGSFANGLLKGMKLVK